jgi:hypothetical protein
LLKDWSTCRTCLAACNLRAGTSTDGHPQSSKCPGSIVSLICSGSSHLRFRRRATRHHLCRPRRAGRLKACAHNPSAANATDDIMPAVVVRKTAEPQIEFASNLCRVDIASSRRYLGIPVAGKCYIMAVVSYPSAIFRTRATDATQVSLHLEFDCNSRALVAKYRGTVKYRASRGRLNGVQRGVHWD